jgi:hypothetical protein
MTDLWNWRDTARSQTTDLVGFQVVATDGAIGNIDAATHDVGGSYIVVDTGVWIFGKKRMLPAGIIDRIDYNDRKVSVNLTKDEIRQAPRLRGRTGARGGLPPGRRDLLRPPLPILTLASARTDRPIAGASQPGGTGPLARLAGVLLPCWRLKVAAGPHAWTRGRPGSPPTRCRGLPSAVG